jgi:hypothetical protein
MEKREIELPTKGSSGEDDLEIVLLDVWWLGPFVSTPAGIRVTRVRLSAVLPLRREP